MKNLIVILAVLALIVATSIFALNYTTKDDSTIVNKSDNIIEKTDENIRNESNSETAHENTTKTDAEEEDKEDTLEKEKTYKNEEKSVFSNSPELIIEEGLIAYYPFNEDVKDYSKEGNNGTNYGAIFTKGKKGQALKFDGKESYVYAPVNINPIPMPQMTMTAWVKTEDATKIRKAVCHDNSGYDRCMGIDNRQGGEGWSCFAGDGKILGYHPVTTDEWTFIATVYNQNAGTVKLFVDSSIYEKKAKIIGGGNDYLLIGANGSTKLQREYFMGAIDEVKIYNYALSDKELNSLYKTGTTQLVLE